MNNYVPNKNELTMLKLPGETIGAYTRRYKYFTDIDISYALIVVMFRPFIVQCNNSVTTWDIIHSWLECNIPINDYTWYGSDFMFSHTNQALMFKLACCNN